MLSPGLAMVVVAAAVAVPTLRPRVIRAPLWRATVTPLASIIDMLAPLGAVVGPPSILSALSSQLSAAVADMAGTGGLLADATRGRIARRVGYLSTAAVALAIAWSADIFKIIVHASKAVVLCDALQSAPATFIAVRPGSGRSPIRAVLFAGGALPALLVLSFGIPADH